MPGANQGAIRQLAGGDVPRLRLSDRDKGSGAVAGLRGPGAGRPRPGVSPSSSWAGRVRELDGRLRDGPGAGASRVRFGGRRREGVLGGSLLGGASPGGSALRGPGLRFRVFGSARFQVRQLEHGPVPARRLGVQPLLLPAGPAVPRSATRRPGSAGGCFGRSALLGRSVAAPAPGQPDAFGGRRAGRAAPRFSRGGSLARLTGALRGSAGPKSPGRGWLRGASSRGHSPGRSSLGGTSLGRGAFGRRRMGRDFRGLRGLRVWAGAGTPRLKAARTGSARLRMPRPKAKRRWRTGGYR